MALEYGNNFDSKEFGSEVNNLTESEAQSVKLTASLEGANSQERQAKDERRNEVKEKLASNEKLSVIKDMLIYFQDEAQDVLRQLKEYEKVVNKEVSTGEKIAQFVLPGLGHLWTLAGHLDGVADSLGYVTDLFNGKNNTVEGVKNDVTNILKKMQNFENNLYNHLSKNEPLDGALRNLCNKISGEKTFHYLRNQYLENAILNQAVKLGNMGFKNQESGVETKDLGDKKELIIKACQQILSSFDLYLQCPHIQRELYQDPRLKEEIDDLRKKIENHEGVPLDLTTDSGRIYWDNMWKIQNKMAKLVGKVRGKDDKGNVINVTELSKYSQQYKQLFETLVGQNPTGRFNEYMQSQTMVKEIIKGSVESGVILALSVPPLTAAAPMLGGGLVNSMFTFREELDSGHDLGKETCKKIAGSFIDGLIDGLPIPPGPGGKFMKVEEAVVVATENLSKGGKVLAAGKKIGKDFAKNSMIDFSKESAKDLLGGSELSADNIIAIEEANGCIALLAPLGKGKKVMKITLQAVNSVGKSATVTTFKS